MESKRTAKGGAIQDLYNLARLYGVEIAFDDVTGRRREASADSLLAVLASLGAPAAKLGDVKQALRDRRQSLWRRGVEPVMLAWDGGPAEAAIRLPRSQARGAWECVLHCEDGSERRWSGRLEELADGDSAVVERTAYVEKRLPLPHRIPLGYHRLVIELGGRQFETLLLAAPTRAYSPQGRGWERSWGVFLPLYALHSQESWGAGDFDDLADLAQWVQDLGGGLVGTLPLLAAFLDEPYEISPYAPVSRLFWNEFYVSLRNVPELPLSGAARELLASSEFHREVGDLRSAPLVDYRRQMALKRRVLEELSRSFFAKPSDRVAAFERYAADEPQLHDYAAFRAVGDRLRTPWSQWPAPLRDGEIKEGDYNEDVKRYHLYAQWLVHQQLEALAERERAGGAGLYLDLPLGVNRDGYDVWRERPSFALGVEGGCPPDVVFPKGQNWGFTPLHPERIRERSYRHVRAFVQHQLEFAKTLRIDHMASFHRVFWIPPGAEAGDGVYVRYPAEELYAVFSLESHRHRTILIGEDLGTVPPEVPAAMARHNFHRMYVVQYEVKPDPGAALPDPPAASVASVNTHDMPPFAAFWEGTDTAQRRGMGLIGAEAAEEEIALRAKFRGALYRFLHAQGLVDEANEAAVYHACLAFLRDSPARLLLVNLEDLWRETQSQNVPSTGGESPNWRRKARLSLEEICADPRVREILQDLARALAPVNGRRPTSR
ncbi:MAG: 4-alpha-glucanotransferase [Planctomycetes bacterium]|nr:4-alpha-glucanotransferase [Planctomycetota bacterium]